jgi:hypothetical protein
MTGHNVIGQLLARGVYLRIIAYFETARKY